jgi:amino acid transporter
MELLELQNIWAQYEKRLADNTRLNKEILKKILISKPEKRLNRIKIKAAFNLLFPICILIIFLFISPVKYRNSIDFYMGSVLFVGLSILTYTWNVMYFLKLRKVDFAKPITSTKKKINELEKYKLKTTRTSYIFIPFFLFSIFLLANVKFTLHFNKYSISFIFLTLLIMAISIYSTRHSVYEQYNRFNKEIKEIEELEKE